ncbi:MAG: hypothetical protein B7Z71_04775 [Acidocella sp. 21-58-7]|nr:MAG: hypothetical protein B7Z71_04775 [Acidocella sp. 21-58-7]
MGFLGFLVAVMGRLKQGGWLVSLFYCGETVGMASKPPDESKLYEAALNHLARYAATEMSMGQVLSRKIDRWGRLYAGDDADPEAVAMARLGFSQEVARRALRLELDEAEVLIKSLHE